MGTMFMNCIKLLASKLQKSCIGNKILYAINILYLGSPVPLAHFASSRQSVSKYLTIIWDPWTTYSSFSL